MIMLTGELKSRSYQDPAAYKFGLLRMDTPLLILLLMLSFIGLGILYSASGQNTDILSKQIIRLTLAFTAMIIIAQIPVNALRLWAPWLYTAGILALIAVFFIGDVGKGAQRWLDLGLLRFQPSEMMKLFVPLMAAWLVASKPLPPKIFQLLIALAIIVIPMLLIIEQPDLGTAMLVGSGGFFVLFLAGIYWRLLIAGAIGLCAMMPFIWNQLHSYQQQRVLTFLNPENDPLGAGYHIIQSKIAIGSGGTYGKGWLNGTQSHLDFLPERSTDFIFSVFGEEFGLFGTLLLLAIYLMIVGRGLYITLKARDNFSRLLCGSISLTFAVYLSVNVGMVTGLLPVVGVPLPLISYGGTSMVTLMTGFGILMAVRADKRFMPG